MKIFRPIDVKLENLLLDPNNPRLVSDLNSGNLIPDSDIERMQAKILDLFSPIGDKEPEKIDIGGLNESMRRLGYIGIDRIVVRKLDGSNKYVVVEGNRRVSTMKKLVQEFEEAGGRPPLTAEKVATFRDLRVMELETEGVSDEVISDRISVILGLRHHGSLLEWEPLPKAHNIYIHYMELLEPGESFSWDRELGREVAGILSIELTEVHKSLRTYIAYLQLNDKSDIDSNYYSLIQAAVTNRKLTGYEYFVIDTRSFLLTADSFDRMYKICQFENRSTLEPNQRIVPRPQAFSQLGQIVERVYRAKQQTVRVLAAALLADVESGELDKENDYALKTTVEDAWLELKAFEEGIEWVTSLRELLDRQEKELNYGDYYVDGNDKRSKDQLGDLLIKFQAIFGISPV